MLLISRPAVHLVSATSFITNKKPENSENACLRVGWISFPITVKHIT